VAASQYVGRDIAFLGPQARGRDEVREQDRRRARPLWSTHDHRVGARLTRSLGLRRDRSSVWWRRSRHQIDGSCRRNQGRTDRRHRTRGSISTSSCPRPRTFSRTRTPRHHPRRPHRRPRVRPRRRREPPGRRSRGPRQRRCLQRRHDHGHRRRRLPPPRSPLNRSRVSQGPFRASNDRPSPCCDGTQTGHVPGATVDRASPSTGSGRLRRALESADAAVRHEARRFYELHLMVHPWGGPPGERARERSRHQHLPLCSTPRWTTGSFPSTRAEHDGRATDGPSERSPTNVQVSGTPPQMS
jgi:hypothetical protein